MTPQSLREVAVSFYTWRQHNFPVWASDQGMHSFDDRLTDYSPTALANRKLFVERMLARMRATDISGWTRDDKIDFILFRSQLESFDFGNRVLKSESTDPQTYVSEASNAIFSLIKKDY
ncbi:MAG: hypothetical protein ACXWHG_14345, partial [Thermoanaerobaculia bacterium]